MKRGAVPNEPMEDEKKHKHIHDKNCNQIDVDLNRCIPDLETRIDKIESFFCLDCGHLKKKNL